MRYSILIILLFVLSCEDNVKEVIEPISITGEWKSTWIIDNGQVYIFEWHLEQKDTSILCPENYYIKIDHFKNSWYYVSGSIVEDSVIIVFNMVQPGEYNYDLCFHYFNGNLLGDIMILRHQGYKRQGYKEDKKFIRQ